jgi:hypothetical protein
MSAVPASRFLTEFQRHAPHAVPSPTDAGVVAASAHEPSTADVEARIQAAFARGCESGKTAAAAAHAAELERERASLDVRIASEREAWLASEGARIAGRMESALDTLGQQLADTVARILKPFLADAIHRKAISELAAALDVLLAAEPGIDVHISGPKSLLQAVKKGLGKRSSAVTLATAETCDVRISAGQTVIETRLRAWLASLEEAAS